MAYANHFNPDALPAHAEPEEAAQILARRESESTSPGHTSNISPPPVSGHASPRPRPDYKNKPQPPVPTQNNGRPQQQAAPHRNTVSGPRPSPLQTHPPHSPISPRPGQPGGPPPVPHLTAGGPPAYQRRTSTPSQTGDAALWPLFQSVDTRQSGRLSEVELGQALRNGDYTTFDPDTVRMMIRMHDHHRVGTIDFSEFCSLWSFLGSWRTLFDRFDEDRSGYISYDEYSNALLQFGYHLTPQFVSTVYRMYDRRGTNALSFDLFVQSCLTLKRLTDVFKKYDVDRTGYITLGFEDFLTEVLHAR